MSGSNALMSFIFFRNIFWHSEDRVEIQTLKLILMKLYIKHMVSLRCKIIVTSELDKLGLHYLEVELGEVIIKGNISAHQRNMLRVALLKSGLELIDDPKIVLIEKIKNTIIEIVHYADDNLNVNYSKYIADKVNYEYNYVSHLFSQATGITVENYIIAHKIELVKELLLDSNLSISEISYKLNYSSVAHLSNQFKKVTGLTPSYFKNNRQYYKRIALENVGIM